jgi:hypothetical protein
MKKAIDTTDNTITALTHSTNNTNYNKNKYKIEKESVKIVTSYIHLLYKKSH